MPLIFCKMTQRCRGLSRQLETATAKQASKVLVTSASASGGAVGPGISVYLGCANIQVF